MTININIIVRTLISDGYLPRIRVILCNNGLAWNQVSQQKIDNADFGNQVNWSHWNHRLKQAIQEVYANCSKISQQRLAGLFRSGELLEFL